MFYLRSSLLRSLLPGSWVLGCWLQAHAMPYLVNNLPHPFCSKSNESHNWGWREEWQVYFGDSAEMCTRAIFYNYYVDLILHDFTISLHHFCWDIYAILFYPHIVYIQSMTLFFVIDRSQWHFLAGLAINFCHWLQSMTDVHKFGVIDWSQWHMAISSSNIGDSNCHWPVNDSFF